MLGKLMKYDFKALSRYLILIHAMLLITAALGRFLFIGRLVDNPKSLSDTGAIIMSIGILLYVILFMTAVFGTLLMIAIHFYKNLYSDEGYLTHTLPVSRTQLLISKTISGSVWTMIDEIMVILSILILVIYKPMIREFAAYQDEALRELGFPASVGYGKIILAILVLLVISAVENVVMIYMSITVGQLFSNHRVLGAIVAYFSINTIIGIVSSVVGGVYSVAAVMKADTMGDAYIYPFFVKTFVFALVLEVVTSVVFYIITQLLMQRKLNLS